MNDTTTYYSDSEINHRMFGVDSMDEWWSANTTFFLNEEDVRDKKMLLMSMLSDVQEMVNRGLEEEARQTLNRAKWMISRKM